MIKFNFKNRNRIKYPFLTDKRQRFAVQTLILTFGLLVTQLIWEDIRFYMVGVLAILTYILTVWSLYEDIKGTEWLLLFILPVFFTISFSLFYFLLPERWISRLIVTVIFAIGMYATLLIENIYNVAAIRSIQLLRAAQSVGMLTTLAVIFLATSIIFSLRLPYFLNAILMFPIILLSSLQSLWSVKLESYISYEVWLYSLVTALGIGEIAWCLSFWPVQIATVSLSLTAFYYAIVGISQLHFSGKLFINTVREYFLVLIFVIFITIIGSHWG